MKLLIVSLICVSFIQFSVGRAFSKNQLRNALKEFFKDYRERNAKDDEDITPFVREETEDDSLNVSELNSDDEDEAESQKVDLPGGVKKPTNTHAHNKEEQKEDNLDRHPPNQKTKGGLFQKAKRTSKRIFEDTSTVWANGKVPYVIDESTFAGSENYLSLLKDILREAIRQLKENTCVEWVPRTSEDDYVKIINDKGCYSYVGKIGGAQPLSIQADGCTTIHTVLHEMLHAMGAAHQQSRSDRAGMTSMKWKMIESGYLNNFEMENTKNAQPYDYKSLMQYELDSFGKNGANSMSIPDMSLEYLITNTKSSLTIYDIGEINSAYQCTASCTNKCENGGVVIKGDGNCGCKCPPGLKGADCSELDTTDGCGGFLTLSSDAEKKTIAMDSYKTDQLCTWIVKGPSGTRIKATIESMNIPYSEYNDCYHWLEFRDYLIGDRGKERCGTTGGEIFTKMIIGDPTRMMIRFNSKKHKDHAPGKGFSVSVQAVKSGCVSSPCKNGAKCTDISGGGFTCECLNGFSGNDCNTLAADAKTKCDFQNDFRACVFHPDTQMSTFEFILSSAVDPNFPGNENGFQYLVIRNSQSYFPDGKAYLVTSVNFEESERCLSMKYGYTEEYYGLGTDTQVLVHYKGDNQEQTTILTLGTSDIIVGSWNRTEVTIPSVKGLKITIEAIEGYQGMGLDDIELKPGACARKTDDDDSCDQHDKASWKYYFCLLFS
ncbi:blastula protease 10-like [Saccostrea echinata]|uniref:blastula protease 10-like n=1 Tax=Saccostrea echinata TaxID=191078 RepID=UPI002A82B76D|nr:blastula protease 10-like [Saccostrea echinata]